MESGWPMGMIPITAKELKEFQDTAERLILYEKYYSLMMEHAKELEDKLEAVRTYLNTFPEKIVKKEGIILYPWFMGLEKLLEAEG